MSEKAAGKDVIYIDVDDEITGIIDKVRGSGQKIVALVLPKRATVLQSVVNMKLLKRASDEAKKHIVLITSEVSLLPLAGTVGMHVAKTLQSKPEIPDGPARPDDKADAVADVADSDDTNAEDDSKPVDKTRPIGELAGAAALEDTIELGDEEDDDTSPIAAADTLANGKPPKGKNKKLKIPNFNRFRLVAILGVVGLVALIALGYVCLAVLPKASVVIKTDSQALTASTVATLKTGDAIKLDVKEGVLPAKAQQVQKTVSQQASASGQQNNGDKAAGSVKITNCTNAAVTIPAGSGVSANGLTYITQTTLPLSDGNFTSGGQCKTSGSHVGTVNVSAQQAGAKYNADAGASFTVAGYSSSVAGVGSALTGGTDNITKIVTQADIDSATQKISTQDTTGIKSQLKTDITNLSYVPIDTTFNTGTPDTKASAKAGDAADTVTITQTITYTMLGVKQDDLQKIIANAVADDIDPQKQTILDYGIDGATFGLQSSAADGATIDLQTEVIAGSDLKTDAIKQQVAGKKAGDAKELIKKNPGVKEVTITYSPFWVSSIPKKTSKITVTIEKPQTVQKASDSNSDASSSD